jgi:hypothetical protein
MQRNFYHGKKKNSHIKPVTKQQEIESTAKPLQNSKK